MKKAFNKLSTFLHVFYHSLIPVDDYYLKVRSRTHIGFSIKYFFSLILLFTMMLIAFLGIYVHREFPPQTLKGISNQIVTEFPEDLTIILNTNGRLVTNYERPYFLFYKDQQNNPLKFVFVVDTKAEPQKIFEYKSRFLFTERRFVIQWNRQVYTIPYFEPVSDIVIDRSSIADFVAKIAPFINSYYVTLLSSAAVAILGLTMMFFVSKLIYLAFIAGIVFLIAMKLYPSLSYKKTFHIGLHSLTGPIVIEFATIYFGIKPPFTLWFFLLSMIFIFASVHEAYYKKEELKTHPRSIEKSTRTRKKPHSSNG